MSSVPTSTKKSPAEMWRICLVLVGFGLIIAAPLVGMIPGPGGIIVFAVGLALVLRNSAGAKRRYVRLKRRWPKLGHWADRGLLRHRKKRGGD